MILVTINRLKMSTISDVCKAFRTALPVKKVRFLNGSNI